MTYDDRPDAEDAVIIDQGYAEGLHEADLAARVSLANAGYYQARRVSATVRSKPAEPSPRAARPAPIRRERPREYLYTRRMSETGEILVAAHLVVKQTPGKVYASRKSYGTDQIGSEDEQWSEAEPAIALDRIKLDRDGSVYSSGHRLSDFYRTLEAAWGDGEPKSRPAFRLLGIRPPASIEDIKTAYRRKAFEAHPDRGGEPSEFQAIEGAYRQLLREAQSSNGA